MNFIKEKKSKNLVWWNANITCTVAMATQSERHTIPTAMSSVLN